MSIRLSRLIPLLVLLFIFLHGKKALSKRFSSVGQARQSYETRQRMGVIVNQIALYAMAGDPLPFRDMPSLQRFIRSHVRSRLGGDMSVDAWRRPYYYQVKGSSFVLISAGPNGKYLDADDITATTVLNDL